MTKINNYGYVFLLDRRCFMVVFFVCWLLVFFFDNRRCMYGCLSLIGIITYTHVDIAIAHPQCTEFTVSGAWTWEKKAIEAPEKLEIAVAMVDKVFEIVDFFNPRVWFIENPVGRIERCVPRLRNYKKFGFHPNEYAGYLNNPSDEAYTKKTFLWGNFKEPVKKYVEPIKYDSEEQNPILHLRDKNGKKLSWSSDEAKRIRSKTPLGFAKAFVQANLVGEPFVSNLFL